MVNVARIFIVVIIGEGTLPWAIFRIFSNYSSQKFEKIKITV